MGRVYFPTVSLNRFGVRDTNQGTTLGGAPRFPAEPTPRAAMTPTGPLLGGVDGLGLTAWQMRSNGVDYAANARAAALERMANLNLTPRVAPVAPIRMVAEAPAPAAAPPRPILATPLISSSGGGGSIPAPSPGAGAPVSAQQTPTPTATLPAPPLSNTILVSSGGGTQTPATGPAVAPAPSSGGLVDGIAAWLGGSTSLFNYNVPNALLAGAVVLGFAWLSSGSGRKR